MSDCKLKVNWFMIEELSLRFASGVDFTEQKRLYYKGDFTEMHRDEMISTLCKFGNLTRTQIAFIFSLSVAYISTIYLKSVRSSAVSAKKGRKPLISARKNKKVLCMIKFYSGDDDGKEILADRLHRICENSGFWSSRNVLSKRKVLKYLGFLVEGFNYSVSDITSIWKQVEQAKLILTSHYLPFMFYYGFRNLSLIQAPISFESSKDLFSWVQNFLGKLYIEFYESVTRLTAYLNSKFFAVFNREISIPTVREFVFESVSVA